MSEIIDGKKIAAGIEENVRGQVQGLGFKPKIVSILVGDDPASHLYVDLKGKAAERVGIDFEKKSLSDSISDDHIIDVIRSLNIDPRVHGIWVQLPLPEGHDTTRVVSSIDPGKDIDCLHPENLGKIYYGEAEILPATVQAVITILDSLDFDYFGHRAVVIGASPQVGKPLSLHLSNKGMTVTVAMESEKNLAGVTSGADLLVSAVGHPGLITGKMIKDGVVVIDVGISKVGDKVVGDVDFESVSPKVSYITPVPGGVGPVTIASLLENTLTLLKN